VVQSHETGRLGIEPLQQHPDLFLIGDRSRMISPIIGQEGSVGRCCPRLFFAEKRSHADATGNNRKKRWQAGTADKSPQDRGVVPQELHHDLGDELIPIGRRQRNSPLSRGAAGNERKQSGEPLQECLPGTGSASETKSQQVSVLSCEQVMAWFLLVRRDGSHEKHLIPVRRETGSLCPIPQKWRHMRSVVPEPSSS
jgi:hypothetical protein